ncbi:hypothetical protein BDW71DRAFT_171842 [Aspergillus fruticulosus]
MRAGRSLMPPWLWACSWPNRRNSVVVHLMRIQDRHFYLSGLCNPFDAVRGGALGRGRVWCSERALVGECVSACGARVGDV